MGWWIVPSAVLAVAFGTLAVLLWRLLGYRRIRLPELPVERVNGIPVLLQNGLPYPGHFRSTSNPKIDLCGEWRFGAGSLLLQSDLPLRSVQVPNSFNTFGSALADYQGPFTYEKRFFLDAVGEGLYRLCFLSVGGRCGVYLNGKKLCENTDSYQPFYCDATAALKAGENVLLVVGDNTPAETTLPPRQFEGHRPGWHLYAGVTKGVHIEILPERYCVAARAEADDQKLVCSAVFAGRPQTCTARLLDKGETIAKEPVALAECGGFSTAQFTLEPPRNIRLWSPDAPNLYTLELCSEAETLRLSVGFRKWSVERGELSLNGEPFSVRGICLHEEDISLGSSLDRKAAERNLELAMELGCNFVRLAHYPHGDETLDLCDEKGLCCWCEIPNYQAGLGLIQLLFGKSKRLKKRVSLRAVWQGVIATKQLVEKEYLKNAGIQLAKMVVRSQNRPCAAFWGVGNECYAYTPASRAALEFLRDTVRLFDAGRFVGYAAFTVPQLTQRFEKSFDVFDVVCANEYFGWYYGQIEDCAAFWLALQKKHQKPMLCTETGSDARLGAQGVDLPKRNANSEAYQARLLARHIRLKDEVPSYGGTCIWALKDFYCEEYGEEDLVPYCNPKGLVSTDYKKKKAFAAVAELYSRER